ncbi:serine/threonine-protein kinase [Nonomuraea jabiensis]|uniref:non-specific serine/threonine protein kinase n=1 Tax=Nonomuraea jabiensis TaxID=882448 RepID=A0A7W9LE37_9ACTN|nr:serine/threonine-protein kinase [Nonomuraea jabiensis]MBB5780431.1 WD40 repeat protein/predicted Ser/Thr protein kinase [Nonomuraea jabiensis]
MEALIAGDPQRIGDYWLAGRLGAGGQGVVYDAYDPDGRRVAVKVLHAAGDRGRFAKEAAAAERVASFCTARLLAADLDGGKPYLVSEYVPGPSLREAVREGRRFTGDDLHRLATAVATALTAIHEAGVVHRDLKPDNVLLGPDGPRVIDFGIARTAEMSLTRTGELAGTPGYMAPEVLTGQRAGMPADVFAWGAIMVFAATGQDPFGGENLGGVMHRVLTHHPDLSALPPGLATLIEAALEKDPRARPSARDLLLALVSGDGSDVGGLLAAGSRRAGGMRVPDRDDPALGAIAEDAYGSLGPEARDLAAEVFLRLVAVNADGQETLRTAGHEELFGGRPDHEAAAVQRILEAFSYVVTTRDGSVALARPGLLRAWPRLRTWMEAERAGLEMLDQINAAARHWEEHGRRDGDVLQGSRLEQALSWAATGRRHLTLTPFERDFLRAGTELTRRRSRRRTLVTTALAGLLAVALVAGGLAVWQRRQAVERLDILTAKQVAAEADRMRTADPSLAMLLSVAAYRVSPQPEARSSLMGSLQQQETAAFRDPPVKGMGRRTLSRDGRTLVSFSEGGVNVYDVRTGRRTASWPGMTLRGTIIQGPALSRSGRLLAQTTSDELGVWDLKTGRTLVRRSLEATGNGGYGVVFGEHETTLVVTMADDVPFLIDVTTGKRFGRMVYADRTMAQTPAPLVDPTGKHLLLPGYRFDQIALPGWTVERPFPACVRNHVLAAYSADGKTLACADVAGDIVLVDAVTGRERTLKETLNCGICHDSARLRFSADGRYIAGFYGRDLEVMRISDQRTVLRYRAEGEFGDVRFDPDGRTLRYLVDDTVISVDLTPRTPSVALPDTPRLSPDAHWAVSWANDAELSVFDLRTRKEAGRMRVGEEGSVLGMDDAGTRLAVAGMDRTITLWDLASRRKLWSKRVGEGDYQPAYVDFTPDGRRIAITLLLGQSPLMSMAVLDAADGRVVAAYQTRLNVGPFLPGRQVFVSADGRLVDVMTGKAAGSGLGDAGALAVSRDGLLAVQESATHRIGLWDVKGPTPLRPVLPRAAGASSVMVFSPDGRTLATSTDEGVLELWDVRSRRRLGSSYRVGEFAPSSMAFGPDGSVLYVGMQDGLTAGAVREVPVGDALVIGKVCARAGRTLTPAEWDRYLQDVPYQDVCAAR